MAFAILVALSAEDMAEAFRGKDAITHGRIEGKRQTSLQTSRAQLSPSYSQQSTTGRDQSGRSRTSLSYRQESDAEDIDRQASERQARNGTWKTARKPTKRGMDGSAEDKVILICEFS